MAALAAPWHTPRHPDATVLRVRRRQVCAYPAAPGRPRRRRRRRRRHGCAASCVAFERLERRPTRRRRFPFWRARARAKTGTQPRRATADAGRPPSWARRADMSAGRSVGVSARRSADDGRSVRAVLDARAYGRTDGRTTGTRTHAYAHRAARCGAVQGRDAGRFPRTTGGVVYSAPIAPPPARALPWRGALQDGRSSAATRRGRHAQPQAVECLPRTRPPRPHDRPTGR